ncbi:hypothetical protein, partial [Streptomyces sp. NPDC055134]
MIGPGRLFARTGSADHGSGEGDGASESASGGQRCDSPCVPCQDGQNGGGHGDLRAQHQNDCGRLIDAIRARDLQRLRLRRLEVEAGLGDEAVDEAGPVLHP